MGNPRVLDPDSLRDPTPGRTAADEGYTEFYFCVCSYCVKKQGRAWNEPGDYITWKTYNGTTQSHVKKYDAPAPVRVKWGKTILKAGSRTVGVTRSNPDPEEVEMADDERNVDHVDQTHPMDWNDPGVDEEENEQSPLGSVNGSSCDSNDDDGASALSDTDSEAEATFSRAERRSGLEDFAAKNARLEEEEEEEEENYGVFVGSGGGLGFGEDGWGSRREAREASGNYRPNRKLSTDDERKIRWQQIIVRYKLSDACVKSIAELLRVDGIEIGTKYTLNSFVQRLSEVEIIKYPSCKNGCTIFEPSEPPASGTVCPHCETPLTKRHRGQTIPAAYADYRTLSSFARLILQDPVLGRELREQNARLIASARSPPSLITDVTEGRIAAAVIEKYPDFGKDDLLFVIGSDGVDLKANQQKNRKEYAWIQTAECLGIVREKRTTNRWMWPLLELGGKKVRNASAAWKPLVDEAIRTEKGIDAFVAAEGKTKKIRIFVVGVKGDTVELVVVLGLVGATGSMSCIWCKIEGVQCSTTHYPIHFSVSTTPNRGDHVKMPAADPSVPKLDPELRTVEDLDIAVVQLENASLNEATRKLYRFASGVTGRSPIRDLPFFDTGFPNIAMNDIMHLIDINVADANIKALKGGPDPPTFRGPQLTKSMISYVSNLMEQSQQYTSENQGDFMRSFEEKFGRYKANEKRTLINNLLFNASFGLNFEWEGTSTFIMLMMKLGRMCEARIIDREGADEGILVDLTKMEEDGSFIVRLSTFNTVCVEFIAYRELLTICRDPRYVANALPSIHRPIHLPDHHDYWGPGLASSAWNIEAGMGDLLRKISGNRNRVVEIRNNLTKEAALLGVELRFDLAHSRTSVPSPSSSSRQLSVTQLPQTALGQPREDPGRFSIEEKQLLASFVVGQGRRIVAGSEAVRWGRAMLANGEELRASSSEGNVQLGLSAEEDAKQRKKSGKAKWARFIRFSHEDGTHEYGEVLTYASLNLCTPEPEFVPESEPRLVAIVSTFFVDKTLGGCFPSFLRQSFRKTQVIGLEQIRMSVGLCEVGNENEEAGRLAIFWSASAIGTRAKPTVNWALDIAT